ncbi:restriction endonuclease subunit S, partial [Thiolapillus sp.]|uniref:restriction endonuclease subunit S n=1 Tax=Thiolapillus sp. TaxID=2017437 RepID=UPI003AF411C4
MRSKSDKKKSLVPRLRFPEFREAGAWEFIPLEAIAPLVNDRVQLKDISNVNYVSTENILQDFGGVAVANKLPTVNSVSSFQAGDVLLANIRPYLKKVWAANFSGGASNDVLVFRPRNSQGCQYVAHILKNNRFIDYVMAGAKGVKMPRGDINSIKEYPVPIPPETTEQQKVAHCLSSLDEVIGLQAKKVQSLKQHKKGLMQQLFPAEGETTPRLRFPEFREAGAWEVKRLGEVCIICNGSSNAQDHVDDGAYPLFDRSEEIKRSSRYLFDAEAVIIPGEGMRFIPKYYCGKFDLHQRAYALS